MTHSTDITLQPADGSGIFALLNAVATLKEAGFTVFAERFRRVEPHAIPHFRSAAPP